MKQARYNEPLPKPRGDVVPRLRAVRVRTLNATVRTRLILERELRTCGLAPPGASTKPTAAVRRVLLNMLAEVDSPFSASLRARAAAAAGKLGLKQATSTLRRIALEEAEDLATRLGAVGSLLALKGTAASRDLPLLLAAKSWQVRAVALKHALESTSAPLRAIGEKHLEKERNAKVNQYLMRRVQRLRVANSTASD